MSTRSMRAFKRPVVCTFIRDKRFLTSYDGRLWAIPGLPSVWAIRREGWATLVSCRERRETVRWIHSEGHLEGCGGDVRGHHKGI